jgi:hypothetical protein
VRELRAVREAGLCAVLSEKVASEIDIRASARSDNGGMPCGG